MFTQYVKETKKSKEERERVEEGDNVLCKYIYIVYI